MKKETAIICFSLFLLIGLSPGQVVAPDTASSSGGSSSSVISTSSAGGGSSSDAVCTDSDGGKNLYLKGTASDGTRRLSDHCNNDGTLTEKYCENGEIKAGVHECPEGYSCIEGACVSPEGENAPAASETGSSSGGGSGSTETTESTGSSSGSGGHSTAVITQDSTDSAEASGIVSPTVVSSGSSGDSSCTEATDPKTGLTKILCEASSARLECAKEVSAEQKNKCTEEGGKPLIKKDSKGCAYMDCVFAEEATTTSIFESHAECPTEEQNDDNARKCKEMGMEAVLVRSGNCKMTRCRKIESAQEDCPVLSSEYHERMRQECTSRNLEVVKKFDDNGCMTLACASRAEDSCDQQVPDEAYDKCSEQGGKLFVKKDESGCIKFTECVKRGEDEEVYYEKDVKVPETTELLSMAFKLEELKMTFDSLSRKSDAIADYYRSVGSSDESRFRRVADMFGSAGKKVDSIKLGIRDRLDSLTEDSVAEIKKDIKYLKDVMLRDILYLMLSGEEVTEASEQATAETSSDEGCGSDFDCFMRHLRICEHTSFTTSSEAGEVTMTISGLEGETCYLKGVSGDMDMDCMVPDYSLGFENTHDELLPHCRGSLAEKLREVSS